MATRKTSPEPETKPEERFDSIQNLMTGLGTEKDKRTYSDWKRNAQTISNEIDTVIVDDDLMHNAVYIPAEEMTRAWIDLLGEEGSAVEKELEVIGAQRAFYEALAWQRAYGTALVVIGLDGQPTKLNDAGEVVVDYSKPIRIGGRVRWLQVFDRYEISGVTYDQMGNPETYSVMLNGKDVEIIHASRILRIDGEPMPRRRREQGNWGQSVVVRIRDTVLDYQSSFASMSNALQDFNVSILYLKGLTQMLASDKTGIARKRIAEMDLMKSLFRMMTLDSEDKHEIQARNFGGVAEMLDRLAEKVSMAARMPVSVLFGRSPAGLNATGDSDIRAWYSHLESQQNVTMRIPLQRLIDIISASLKIESPIVKFSPLWKLTELESATLHVTQAQADSIYLQAGVVDAEEIANSRFGPTGYSTETQLDDEVRDEIEEDENEDELNTQEKEVENNDITKPEIE